MSKLIQREWICYGCNGSGEGMTSYCFCSICGGSGVIYEDVVIRYTAVKEKRRLILI